MAFWRNVSPGGAVADFANVWRDNPQRWRVLAVSIAATTGLMTLFIPETQVADPPKPKITYITAWSADRSDAEIIASNIANQKRKEEREAMIAAAEERRKEIYRALGRATGLDVDAMEKDIAREEAAEAAAKAKPAPEREGASAAQAEAEKAAAGPQAEN
ncbi:conserved hypothetical protein [Altererythrobacter sp. B11]|uniref:hypothetical protein n=1 Tax=Altererythrobacter sp. B11 TaxID=2060312 RepID=UPI000DC71A54|nr:hypothetical protein [Altererythrobacter sp. B11]BBC71994.1 conserved hypothetical protein [Altererythrobacter sp. B11]